MRHDATVSKHNKSNLRAYFREWTLAQRTYDDFGRQRNLDTSAPMENGQVKGTKGKGKKGKKGKGKENDKGKNDKRELKGNTGTDDFVGTVASGDTRKLRVGSRRTKEANLQMQHSRHLQQCNKFSRLAGVITHSGYLP